jgi:hypothetical protein
MTIIINADTEPILSQVLARAESLGKELDSAKLTLLLAVGLQQLGLPASDNPDHPLVKQLGRLGLASSLILAEITKCYAELVKFQHEGKVPDELLEEYAHIHKIHVGLLAKLMIA